MADRSCWNLLRQLGMAEGEPVPPPSIVWLDGAVDYVIATLPISEGEPVAKVSRIKAEPRAPHGCAAPGEGRQT